jgi:hypothetical protein
LPANEAASEDDYGVEIKGSVAYVAFFPIRLAQASKKLPFDFFAEAEIRR